MFRLLILTVAGLFLVLFLVGKDQPGDGVAQTQPVNAAAQPSQPPVQVSLVSEKPPVITDVQQTPTSVQPFPGPALRPSPEHAGREAPVDLAAAPAGATLFVTGNSVNFRSGPTTNDSVVGALRRGQQVQAIGPTDADWIEIRTPEGRSGFMSRQFLSAQRP